MPEAAGGLAGSVRRLAGTALEVLQTRLALLSNEWEEERVRLGRALLLAYVAAMCFMTGAVLVSIFIALLFWEEHRLLAVAIPAVSFLLAAAWLWWRVTRLFAEKPRLFQASLAELARDRELLKE